jgi:hypothetical protein
VQLMLFGIEIAILTLWTFCFNTGLGDFFLV